MDPKITALLEELESLAGTDQLECQMDGLMEQIEALGAGLETVPLLLGIMERHPLDDFGMPGAMVHFMEQFFTKGYEEELTASIRRKPTAHTMWMANRLLNSPALSPVVRMELMALLGQIAGDPAVEPLIRERAKEYLEHQLGK